MFRYLNLPILVCALAFLAGGVNAAQSISESQARALAPAVAKVLLQRASTNTLLRDCGQRYPQLKLAAGHATTHWLQANRQVLGKADSLRERLLQSIKQQRSRFAAEKFGLDIDLAVQQSVQHVEHALAAYPPPQQRALCNHLIFAVNAGEWDVQYKQAEAFAIVQSYH